MLSYEDRVKRQETIGASEIGAVLGVSPFKSRLDVYLDKTTPVPEIDPLADNSAVMWGNLLEPVIADLYAAQNNLALRICCRVDSDEHPWLSCTPDRVVYNKDHGVEIKTTSAFTKDWTSSLPQSYLLQAHQCMLVLDYPIWTIVVLIGGQEMKSFDVHRDYEIDKIIIEESKKFWYEHVVPRVPPKAEGDAKSLETLKRLFDKVEDTQVDLSDDETMNWVEQWSEAKKQITKYESAAKICQGALLERIGNNGTGVLADGSQLIRKVQKRKGFTVADSEFVTLTHKGSKK